MEISYKGDIKFSLSLNLYTYSWNNPIKYVDPSGYDPYRRKYMNEARAMASEQYRKYNIDDIVSFGSSILPIVGDGKDIQEVITGTDIFTGEKLTSGERAITVGLALIPFVGGKFGREALEALGKGTSKTKLLTNTMTVADHHIIPKFRGKSKKYADFIASRAIDVDKFTVTLVHGKASHHLKFIHGQGKWNKKWMDWIDNNPDATAKDIYQFAGKMMDEFGLSRLNIHPYRK